MSECCPLMRGLAERLFAGLLEAVPQRGASQTSLVPSGCAACLAEAELCWRVGTGVRRC